MAELFCTRFVEVPIVKDKLCFIRLNIHLYLIELQCTVTYTRPFNIMHHSVSVENSFVAFFGNFKKRRPYQKVAKNSQVLFTILEKRNFHDLWNSIMYSYCIK